MNRFKKTKGAVSIFLVIILVPMMTVSALFVDASKVSLAKSVSESAGDLTLNTALTDYDTKLKDMYGLFATAQNTDELYASLEDYYRSCITSSGVSNEDADSYVDQIMAQLGLVGDSGDVSDVLNMELVDFSVNKNSDATLSNASVMKKQIVDFMKYRAPINTGLSFLSSIQTFKTLSKQSELVDKRQDYYKEEESVMKTLKSAWEYINKYNSLPLITDENYFSDMQKNLKDSSGWENDYKFSVNRKTIMDLYDTQNYIDYYCNVQKVNNVESKNAAGDNVRVDLWRFTYSETGVSAPLQDYTQYYPKRVGGYDKNKRPTADGIKSLMNSFYRELQKMDSYGAEIKKTSAPVDVYDLQYLVQTNRKNLGPYTSSAQSVYTVYQKLKNAMIWVEAYDDDAKKELKDTQITVNSKSDKLSSQFSTIESKYESAMNEVSGITKTFSDISQELNKGEDPTNTTKTNDLIKGISDKVSGYVDNMEKAKEYLDNASKKLNEAKTSVESGKLYNAKNAWEGAANDNELKNTSMARQDKAEIQELGTYLNTQEIEKMVTRLKNISDNLQKSIDKIKKYKFDGTFIGDIKGYGKAESLIESKVGAAQLKSVKLSTPELKSQADGWFSWESGKLDVSWVNKSGTQVYLHGKTDKLNFYSYLYTHFNTGEVSAKTETKSENKSDGQNLYDDIKKNSDSKASDDAKNAEKGNITNSKDLSSLVTKGWPSKDAGNNAKTPSSEIKTGDSAAKDTSKSLSSMFKNLGDAAAKMGTDLRDKLYVSDYVLSMFSYDTIEKETEKKSGKDAEVQTLTLTPMNTTNNYAYGKEVEYIIYGGSNSSNLTKAYGSIYGIRFGFNVIYAFMDSSIRDTAFAIATPISAATLGVIPAPLIQAAIIIGIACCESALDLQELKSGESVPLFKNKKTWKCSVSGLMNEAREGIGNALKDVTDSALDAGIEKLNDLLDMTDDQLNEFIKDGTDKVVSSVSASYDTLIERHANTAIQKLTTLCNNAIEKYASDPAVSMADEVTTGLDDWLKTEGESVDKSSDFGYIVKAEAVKLIKEKYVQGLLDEMQKISSDATSSISSAAETLKKSISRIRSSITDKITSASGKVIAYKDKMKEKVKESMKGGAGKLKDTLNQQIDGIFGSNSGDTDSTGMASLLSFSYSDYLRLFLMIGLYTNEEGVLLRTGDVIQANMRQDAERKDFKLSDSAVYVDLYAKVQVKPTLLALPLFADVEGNPSDNVNWYTVEYKSTKGY